MRIELDQLLDKVDLKANIANTIIEIDDEKLRAVGFAPSETEESRLVMAEKHVKMGDLFFLEPPRTFEQLKYYHDTYKVKISMVYEPIDTIKIRRS